MDLETIRNVGLLMSIVANMYLVHRNNRLKYKLNRAKSGLVDMETEFLVRLANELIELQNSSQSNKTTPRGDTNEQS